MSKTLKEKVTTPIGRISFPYLYEPDSGRSEYSDDKYKTDFLIDKGIWKVEGKPLVDAVLKVAAAFFGKPGIKLTEFKNPFKDTDKIDKISDENQKGCILIKCKTTNPPLIINAQKREMTRDEIKNLKGGDYGRLVVTAFPYKQQGGGVSLALNAFQFWKEGEAFGGGKQQFMDMVSEMEVGLEDGAEAMVPSESSTDDVAAM